MKKLNIGLDFGTSQTKVCVYDLELDTHEFFKFPTNDSFFLPSVVGYLSDGKLAYGDIVSKLIKQQYSYFKIASAQDEAFLMETFEKNISQQTIYSTEDFFPFTPEFLSVLYLTYVLYTLKGAYKNKKSDKVKTGKLLQKLLKSKSREDFQFTVQLGIPTEWSQRKNLMRKRKFETILWLADALSKQQTFEEFMAMKKDQLVKLVELLLKNKPKDQKEFDSNLNNIGLSVFPETAAGLNFVVNTRQIKDGYYCVMDIGGGSTDISFFSIRNKNRINYLASESYVMAANNVYELIGPAGKSLKELKKVEDEVRTLLDDNACESNADLIKSIKVVNANLNKLIKKLFQRRVYFYKDGVRTGIKKSYSDQMIIVYGGGSRLPTFDNGQVSIYDNGHPGICEQTYLEKFSFEFFKPKDNLLPKDNNWKKDFCLLVVALGLSYPKSDGFATWLGEDEYQMNDAEKFKSKWGLDTGLSKEKAREVAHPFNEDCFIYDVLASKWI